MLSDRLVGDAYRSQFAHDLLADLTDVGDRMAGRPGERAGAELVREAFEAAGLREPRLSPFEVPGWDRGTAALTVEEPTGRRFDRSHEVIALPGTPACERTAPVVDVGAGGPGAVTEADLEGAFALVSSRPPAGRGPTHRREKYARVVDAGAVGFLFHGEQAGGIPPTGEVGYVQRPAPVPAVGLSAELAARLRRHCEDGDAAAGSPPTVTLAIDCEHGEAASYNVEADLGPDSDERLLVTAHHDAHDVAEGANDNAAGCAVLAEVGRLLAQAAGDLEVGVRFVAFGAEEPGLYGSHHWAETHDLEAVTAALNLDGVATAPGTRLVGTDGHEAIADRLSAAAADLNRTLERDPGAIPYSDHWAFLARCAPGVLLTAADTDAYRRWDHTHADTLDKIDDRTLREQAVLVANGVHDLAADPVERPELDPETVRASLADGCEDELRTTGLWPFED